MSEFPDSSSKGANPTFTVNRRKTRIKSTDPRNNALNTIVGDTYIIDDTDMQPNEVVETFEDIANLTLDQTEETTPQITNLYQEGSTILAAPENLSIDDTSFREESVSSLQGDGNVYFTVTLNFDDVLGAAGYEYIINASD